MQDHRDGLPMRLTIFLVAALVIAACVGRQNVAPSSTPPPLQTAAASRAPTVRPTISAPQPKDVGCADIIAAKPPPRAQETLPPPPQPTIAGGDATSHAAIARAIDALAALRSYKYTLDIVGREITTLSASSMDFGVEATVDRSADFALDGILGSRIRETNGTGASVSGGFAIKAGDGYLWEVDNVSEVPEPSGDPQALATIALMTPEGAAGRFIVPFAAGYRRVGSERHLGIATDHFRATKKGVAAYAAALQFKGPMTADLWIASEGGYVADARVVGKNSENDPTFDDGFILGFEVTHVNDPANVVTLPVPPVPDPARPSGPPVDLQLTLRVLPKGGQEPRPDELDAIGVALRTRLDVYTRPVKVDIVGLNKVVVTVCGTTNPDADRRLITSRGALTVVPLPKDGYGTAADPGPTALPAVGSSIDPVLTPIAPPSGLGLTTAHVDPTTGQRGLAFRLSNKATDLLTAYAAQHPGEFVAVVLDDTVLATIPIDERLARGHFAFTGDYTEAESRNLASYLYRDPIPYELQPIEDIEIPAWSG